MATHEVEQFAIEFEVSFSGPPTSWHIAKGIGETVGKAVALITSVETMLGDLRRSDVVESCANFIARLRPSREE